MLPLFMKISLAARKRTSAILMAVALATFTSVGPQVAEAQTAPEKIQLMASALRARDAGDLTLAKEKAEELIKIAPDDGNVQRLLASINKDLDRRAGSGVVFGQARRCVHRRGNDCSGYDCSDYDGSDLRQLKFSVHLLLANADSHLLLSVHLLLSPRRQRPRPQTQSSPPLLPIQDAKIARR